MASSQPKRKQVPALAPKAAKKAKLDQDNKARPEPVYTASAAGWHKDGKVYFKGGAICGKSPCQVCYPYFVFGWSSLFVLVSRVPASHSSA